MNQKKLGIFLSYINLILSSAIGIFFAPFLIKSLGETEYGVYQSMNSFAGYLVLMNFGIGTVMTRNVSLYLGKKDKHGEENYIAMCLVIAVILSLFIAVIAGVFYINIGRIYAKTLTYSQILHGKRLFIVMAMNIIVTLWLQAVEGIIIAYERFMISKWLQIGKGIMRVLLLIILLNMGLDSLTIVLVDLCLAVTTIAAEAIYCVKNLRIRVHYYGIEITIFKESILFSLSILLQAIVNQVNSSVDIFLIGIMIGPGTVTLYSIAITIYAIFSSMSTVAISVYLPHLTKMVAVNASRDELTDAVIKPSRTQTLISGTILFGFALTGRNFIEIWMGAKFVDAWAVAMIIMIPMFINYSNGIVVSILDAMQRRMVRSVVIFIVAIINVILTIIFINQIGYIGAAIATAIATFIGQITIMNIYYHKVIGLNIPRMFREIYKGIIPSLLCSSIITLPFVIILRNNLSLFLVKGIVFLFALFICLWLFGLNAEEKNEIIKWADKLKEIGRNRK